VSDFLTELRGDLVDAHARYGERGRAGRLARPVHPRTWRPAAMLGAALATACLIAGIVAMSTLHGPAPAPTPASPLRVVARFQVSGDLADATLGFGYVWTINSHNGVITKVDPASGRVVRVITVDLPLDSITAGTGAIWATTSGNPAHGLLLRIDPGKGRVTATWRLRGYSVVSAAGDGAVWMLGTEDRQIGLERLDPATGRTTLRLPTPTLGDAIAIGGGSLWTLDAHGVLSRRDPRTGQALRRVPALGSPLGTGGEKVLVADATGVWLVRPGALVRVTTGGSVVRRIPLPADTMPLLAEARGDLWLARGATGVHPRLLRFDAGTGKLTGSLDLGSHQSQALVPSPRGLWVVCADGTALLVR
jgi:streptogramin lyase